MKICAQHSKMEDNVVDSTTDPPEKSGKRNGARRNHYTTVKMAPCKVCGGTSTGYHFGVVSCEACKAFFRRAIAKESYNQYVCQKGNNCDKLPRKISSCYACRFRRCLEAGMSKRGVRRGRYSIELRTKSILDAQRVENERLKSKESQKTKTSSPSAQSVVTNQSTQSTAEHFTDIVKEKQSNEIELVHQVALTQQSDCSDSCRNTCISCNINLTNENQSLIRAMCDGYSICRNSECVCGSNITCYKEPSPCSEPVSSTSKDILTNLDLSTEFLKDIDMVGELNNTPEDLMQPWTTTVYAKDEDILMERLIQKLVILQGALYPHHKVTEDILMKQKIIEKQHHQREEAFLCMFGSTEYTSSHEFQEVLSEVNIELDDRLIRFREKARATESSIVLYIYHSKFIPGFNTLNKEDVSKILKASYSEFWLFSNFATMNKETGVSGGTDVVINGHKKVIKTFFPKDWVDDIFAFAATLQKLELTVEEVALIRVIVLTFNDRCPLKEPRKVERLNQLFIRCLRFYLNKSVHNASARFYKIFDRLIAVRTLMHKNRKVNEKFLKEWGFLMVEFPLWKEMMVSQLPHLQKIGT